MEESKPTQRGNRGNRGRGHKHYGRIDDRRSRGGHRGGHGRGGKGQEWGYDNRNIQNRRPQTGNNQHQGYNQHRNKHNSRYNHRGSGGNFRGNREYEHRQINAPKDSYYYKYFYGPYPEVKEIKITIDTEIPFIKEENLLPRPSGEEYAKRMKACDDKIQDLRSKITEINDKKRLVTSTKRKESEKSTTEIKVKGKTFKELLNEKLALEKQRKELNELLEKQDHGAAKVHSDMRKLNKFIDKDLKTVDAVDRLIKELENESMTTTMPVAKEKEMFKRMKFLEKSKQYYTTFEGLQKKSKTFKDHIYETKGKINALSKKIRKYNNTLDSMNEEFKSKMKLKDKFSEELDTLEEKIQEVKKEIGTLFEKKNEIREQHYKERFNYEAQLEEIEYHKYLQRQLDELIANQKRKEKEDAEKQRKEEEKLEKRKNMPNPYIDEINNCAYLITQLRLKKRDHENYLAKLEADRKRKEDDIERKKEIEKQQEEGKIIIHHKKEDNLVIGRRNKKKKNKNKKVNEEAKVETAPHK